MRAEIPEPDALRCAREALTNINAQAREEGYGFPSEAAKATATRLLGVLYRLFPRAYEIYPTSDREIAVDAPGASGRGVLILCDPSGGATCFVTMDGVNRRARYEDASKLPDAFIVEAMRELAQ